MTDIGATLVPREHRSVVHVSRWRRLVVLAIACGALGACTFPVDEFTVATGDAAVHGNLPHDAGAEPDTESHADDSAFARADDSATAHADDSAPAHVDDSATAPPDSTAAVDSEPPPPPRDSGSSTPDTLVSDEGADACRCVEYAGKSGHCKRWEPPSCGGPSGD